MLFLNDDLIYYEKKDIQAYLDCGRPTKNDLQEHISLILNGFFMLKKISNV